MGRGGGWRGVLFEVRPSGTRRVSVCGRCSVSLSPLSVSPFPLPPLYLDEVFFSLSPLTLLLSYLFDPMTWEDDDRPTGGTVDLRP